MTLLIWELGLGKVNVRYGKPYLTLYFMTRGKGKNLFLSPSYDLFYYIRIQQSRGIT